MSTTENHDKITSRPGEDTYAIHSQSIGDAETPAEPTSRGVLGIPYGTAMLAVKRGPNAGIRFTLDKSITSVGRHIGSDILLDDVTVSRRHAEFVRHGDAYLIVDVGSLNGIYVNREPVTSAELINGDQIQIGKFRLVFLTARTRRVRGK